MRTLLLLAALTSLAIGQFTPFANQYGLIASSEITPGWPVDTYSVSTSPLFFQPRVVQSPELVDGELLAFVWNPVHLNPRPPALPVVGIPLGMLIDRRSGGAAWFDTSSFVQLAPDAWATTVPRVADGNRIEIYFLGLTSSTIASFWRFSWDYVAL